VKSAKDRSDVTGFDVTKTSVRFFKPRRQLGSLLCLQVDGLFSEITTKCNDYIREYWHDRRTTGKMELSLDFSQLVITVRNAGAAGKLNELASKHIGDLYNLLLPSTTSQTSVDSHCIRHSVKASFHDTDTDIDILADVLTRIVARMSVSVTMSVS